MWHWYAHASCFTVVSLCFFFERGKMTHFQLWDTRSCSPVFSLLMAGSTLPKLLRHCYCDWRVVARSGMPVELVLFEGVFWIASTGLQRRRNHSGPGLRSKFASQVCGDEQKHEKTESAPFLQRLKPPSWATISLACRLSGIREITLGSEPRLKTWETLETWGTWPLLPGLPLARSSQAYLYLLDTVTVGVGFPEKFEALSTVLAWVGKKTRERRVLETVETTWNHLDLHLLALFGISLLSYVRWIVLAMKSIGHLPSRPLGKNTTALKETEISIWFCPKRMKKHEKTQEESVHHFPIPCPICPIIIHNPLVNHDVPIDIPAILGHNNFRQRHWRITSY